MASKKRVAAFYRVSTQGQLDGVDIPMQRRACQKFIVECGWELVKEYIEKGISGYKKTIEERDEIQRAKRDAENGVYDILLCFMFDRLGRKTYESSQLLKWFNTQGVEIWSVKEGQQQFKTKFDDTTNYLHFWQSNNESEKTSIRVDEKHTQMARDGLYRGGTAPFGYKLVKSGFFNKKGKELMKLEINKDQESVVKQIFAFVKEEGYGSNRIAKYLNEHNIKTATDSNWNTGSINFILRNPIYKGYPTYGKRKSKEGVFETKERQEWIVSELQQKHLVIIEEIDFDNIQIMRSTRSVQAVKNHTYERKNSTLSPLLFVGIIKCGCCGAPLTTTYNSKTYKLASGEIQKWKRAVYRCSGKALRKNNCTGQTIYSKNKIEDTILNEVEQYLNHMTKLDYKEFAKDYDQEEYRYIYVSLDSKNQELRETYLEIDALKKEVVKSILGDSAFKPKLLSEMIEQKEKEIDRIDLEVRELEKSLRAKKIELSGIMDLAENVAEWKKRLEETEHEKKKLMLKGLIEEITVNKGFINLNFRMDVVRFFSRAGNGSVEDLRKRTHHWQ